MCRSTAFTRPVPQPEARGRRPNRQAATSRAARAPGGRARMPRRHAREWLKSPDDHGSGGQSGRGRRAPSAGTRARFRGVAVRCRRSWRSRRGPKRRRRDPRRVGEGCICRGALVRTPEVVWCNYELKCLGRIGADPFLDQRQAAGIESPPFPHACSNSPAHDRFASGLLVAHLVHERAPDRGVLAPVLTLDPLALGSLD